MAQKLINVLVRPIVVFSVLCCLVIYKHLRGIKPLNPQDYRSVCFGCKNLPE